MASLAEAPPCSIRLSDPTHVRCPFRFNTGDVVRSHSSGTIGYVGEGWYQATHPGYRVTYDIVSGGRVTEFPEEDLVLVARVDADRQSVVQRGNQL